MVHFAYGLLLVVPAKEFIEKGIKIRSGAVWWFAWEFIMATSMLYELAEWLVAILLSPEAAEAYNGQQGDMWDAQKDMGLATLGALLTILFLHIARRIRRGKSKENTFSPTTSIELKG